MLENKKISNHKNEKMFRKKFNQIKTTENCPTVYLLIRNKCSKAAKAAKPFFNHITFKYSVLKEHPLTFLTFCEVSTTNINVLY